MPVRPSTARTRSKSAAGYDARNAGGTTRHSQLVAELADAKGLLDEIKSEQRDLQLRVSRTLSESQQNENDAGNPQSSDAPETNKKTKSSKGTSAEESIVKAAIVEAVQMQMLRQWPSRHMSLRVRRLVHTQLRSRAEIRAENVELDHATQRLTGKKKNSSTATSNLLHMQEVPGRGPNLGDTSAKSGSLHESRKPQAPHEQPHDTPSAFQRMRSVSGASPLPSTRR